MGCSRCRVRVPVHCGVASVASKSPPRWCDRIAAIAHGVAVADAAAANGMVSHGREANGMVSHEREAWYIPDGTARYFVCGL